MQIESIKIADLVPYEHNPRINDKAVGKLANSIKEFGFINPIVIDKDNVIIAGHTRLKAAKKLKLEEVPCIRAAGLTDEQVKAFRLADNKLAEIVDIDMADFGFPDLDMEESAPQMYNSETKIPQYEVQGDDVTLQMLCDHCKHDELVERIEGSDVPEDIKEFLKMAATRHYVFNYKYIAEYYAQAPKDVQELMEDSALVIIDYEDAIAKGYVELSKTLQELTENEE